MPDIQYGEWLPDRPRPGNPCITARNVIPSATGYLPMPGPAVVAAALSGPCVGIISFRRVDGVAETFAGTATGLFRLAGAGWTNISRTVGYTASTFWRFAVFGGRLVATNGVDAPQKFDVASDALFTDLPGAPIHRFPIVIRDTLVALDVRDGSGFQIKWSAVNNSEKWTADCGGGAQSVPDGGPVVGGTGGEVGIVVQDAGLTRMNFVGGDLRFTFDKLEGSIGSPAPDSIVVQKGQIFYLSEEGFQVFDGARSTNISDSRVSRTFFAEVTDISTVKGALDARNASIVWSYETTAGRKMIRYRYSIDRWADADLAIDCPHASFRNQRQVLAGFDATNALAELTGTALQAIVSTGDIPLARDRRSVVRSVAGLVDGPHSVTVGARSYVGGPETVKTWDANTVGRANILLDGLFHRFEVRPSGAWTEIVGVNVDAVAGARR